jgi:AcrR family transcriptional regulator
MATEPAPNAPPPTRRRQQREETRRQILAAAEEILSTQSLRDLSIDGLMRRTGHTRTVFYRHFADVPDLLLALLESVSAELLQIGRDFAAGLLEPDQLRPCAERIVDCFARHGPVLRAIASGTSLDAEIAEIYDNGVNAFVAMIADGIDARIAAGAMPPVDVEETARALNRLNERYLLDRCGHGEPVDRERVANVIYCVWARVLNMPEAELPEAA